MFFWLICPTNEHCRAVDSGWPTHFWLIICNSCTDFNEALQEQVAWMSFSILVFCDPSTTTATLTFEWLKHFCHFLCNCWMDFDETLQEASPQRSCQTVIQDGRSGLRFSEAFNTPVFRRDVLWYGNVCLGRYQSVSFPQYSPTCFNLFSWNLV